MDVDTAIKEVDEAITKEIGEKDEGFHEGLRAALSAVNEAAGGAAVEDLTSFVAGHVREHADRPAPVAVDQRAAEVVREHDAELPENSYLRNA
ncbi:hypothetical protein [Halolamina salifodinae]|uniref:Uncharacterized protein n=1 Tax=Halolamina salifodinae TaxID=1202767 RepID=A0A8T4GWV1_9EURY|nr:hypothetical protein [Halolamina salifodinae]MBP1986144.1 hypothetical protein [Halolamina salifodinae]